MHRPLGFTSAQFQVSQKDDPVTEMHGRTYDSIPEDIAAVFASYPEALRAKLLALRKLILDTASATRGVGRIEEALRWGEPSFLTSETRSGSTIRIGGVRGVDDQYAVYFSCQTTLVATFRQIYPDLFAYSGNRAILFQLGDTVPGEELKHCIALALCYHLDNRRNGGHRSA